MRGREIALLLQQRLAGVWQGTDKGLAAAARVPEVN